MAKYVVFPNSFIDANIIKTKPFVASLSGIKPQSWVNDIQMIKCIKISATRENHGCVLFDNVKEAVAFVSKYGGHVTDTRNGQVITVNNWATAFDPESEGVLEKFITNKFGTTISTILLGPMTFVHFDGPGGSLRITTYLNIPEIKAMAKRSDSK